MDLTIGMAQEVTADSRITPPTNLLRLSASEPPAGQERRKFKGRVVFQGNNVKDEAWNSAIFQKVGSCAAAVAGDKPERRP